MDKPAKTQFDWSGDAIQYTLKKRDRYTEDFVRRDLEAAPLKNAVILDAKTNLYATSVGNNRYAVVWQMFPAQNLAKVKFVVPTQMIEGQKPEELKKSLDDILKYETRGRYTLGGLTGEQQAPASKAPSPKP